MPEYNPENERLKKQYEDVLLHGAHKDPRTADAVWKAINTFENFTGRKDFARFSADQAKGFKRDLTRRKNAKGEPLSMSSVRSTLAQCRAFFQWLALHPKYIRKVDGTAAAYLQLSNNDERAGRATREGPVPTLEQLRAALEAMPHGTDVEKRNRAIVAFTALTGVRDAALISLRLDDVDPDKREVWQNPRHVRTKNRKGITTFFMAFDPLWEEIVLDWLTHVRESLRFTDKDPLFPKEAVVNDPKILSFRSAGLSREHWANATPVREIFKAAFAAAGLPYFRPHSFRKMIVRWAMEHCTQRQVKAISQNLGHAHTMTTYNAYGTLPAHDQAKAIAAIGQGSDLALSDIPQDAFMAELARRMGR